MFSGIFKFTIIFIKYVELQLLQNHEPHRLDLTIMYWRLVCGFFFVLKSEDKSFSIQSLFTLFIANCLTIIEDLRDLFVQIIIANLITKPKNGKYSQIGLIEIVNCLQSFIHVKEVTNWHIYAI